jgi:hypothetical protein
METIGQFDIRHGRPQGKKKSAGVSRTFLVEQKLTQLGFLNDKTSSEGHQFSSVRNLVGGIGIEPTTSTMSTWAL